MVDVIPVGFASVLNWGWRLRVSFKSIIDLRSLDMFKIEYNALLHNKVILEDVISSQDEVYVLLDRDYEEEIEHINIEAKALKARINYLESLGSSRMQGIMVK